MQRAKITHRACSRTHVQGIARCHQHDPQIFHCLTHAAWILAPLLPDPISLLSFSIRMSVLISDAEVSIRLMRNELADYQVMSKWLSDPRVLEFYEGRDHPLALEQIQSEYARCIRGEEDVTPCLIMLQSVPIGYMQFYLVGEESRN